MRAALALLALLTLCGCSRAPSTLIPWAWERPEDLRFLGTRAEVAVHAGFVELRGDTLFVRGRRHPLRVETPPSTTVVHVQIAQGRPVRWSPGLRAKLAAAILHFARDDPAPRFQLDFEVRESERPILLDTLADLRRGLPRGTLFSMTAIASWCDTETWLEDAPVDEIVPMLFRMGKSGISIRAKLAKGWDFHNKKCRTALAVSTDSPIVRAPPGRRVYLFNPASWTPADFEKARRTVEAWR